MSAEFIELANQAPTLAFALLVWYELRQLRTEVTRVLTAQLQQTSIN